MSRDIDDVERDDEADRAFRRLCARIVKDVQGWQDQYEDATPLYTDGWASAIRLIAEHAMNTIDDVIPGARPKNSPRPQSPLVR